MGLVFRLDEYSRYLEKVGEATYLDITRRTDPARIERVWENLRAVLDAYGPPWIAQLWTKDVAGALTRGKSVLAQLLRGDTTLTAQITATGLGGTLWEPLAPREPFLGVDDLISLAGSPSHIKWRYDPVIPTIHRIDTFSRLAESITALGITRCVINFLVPPGRYKRVDTRLAVTLSGWAEGMPGYDEGWRFETAAEIVEVGRKLGLTVSACAESSGLVDKVDGLLPAACGDYLWFVEISGRDPGRAPGPGSRPKCGCAAYFDVGLYGQWRRCHQCLYCYAG
jgi:hypothetical protein